MNYQIQEDTQDRLSCILLPNKYNTGGLYLSSLRGAKNLERLQELNIKAVVTALAGSKLEYPRNIINSHLIINAPEHKPFDLINELNRTFQFIDEQLEDGNVLIHCFAGRNRSAALVIAYLMNKRNLSFDSANKYITKRRKIYPNNEFVHQLKQYEQILFQQPSSGEQRIKETSIKQSYPRTVPIPKL